MPRSVHPHTQGCVYPVNTRARNRLCIIAFSAIRALVLRGTACPALCDRIRRLACTAGYMLLPSLLVVQGAILLRGSQQL
jgi:hypothetical protein